MAGRTQIARVLCAIALFSFAFLLSPHRAGAFGEASINSPGPLTQIFISADLNCQVAYAGDASYEFFPGSDTLGSCGTFLAVAGGLYGPSDVPSGSFSNYFPWTQVSQSPVAGGGSSAGDPFQISTVVDALGPNLRLEEIDSYAVGSRSYKTEISITNNGAAPAAAILYRAGDCYLQESDTGFGRIDGGAVACIVDPSQGQRIEQWLPITVGSHYMESGYSDIYAWMDTQQQFPDTCLCDTAVDNGAGLSWPVNVGPGQTITIVHETFFSPVGLGPVTNSLVGSVPDPLHITLDPVVVAQSVALTAGVIVLVPFPSALFNNTLEENYAEVMGWLARIRAGLDRMWARFVASVRGRIDARKKPTTAQSAVHPLSAGPVPPVVPPVASTEHREPSTGAPDRWQSPIYIGGFVVLTALLYAFLDPTFGLSLNSLAELAGLALGLFAVMLAWGVPLLVISRRDHFPLTIKALPATLIIGLACVLISRLANFQPGYLYGLIVGFFIAHGTDRAVEGRAKAAAAATTLVVALAAWVLLAVLRGSAPADALSTLLLEAAAVTVVVAGLENAVFAMLPLRFMPGAAVFNWNRRVWTVLMALGLFGFVHVLLNPAAGSGYLADSTRTSFVTLVVLLLFFGLASVAFWAYFRYRPRPVGTTPPHQPAA